MAEQPFGLYAPSDLTFDDRGLIPAIIQIGSTGEVVMLGYMNEESLRRTLELGQAVFWSRSRQELWHKGASSGDYLDVTEVLADCDQDTLVVKVELAGKAVCHTGARSDFVEADDATPRRVVASR
jgi:phosphoribosyl-AMP cyclohydrolase